MKRFICWLIGHDERYDYPVADSGWQCIRCGHQLKSHWPRDPHCQREQKP